MDYRRLIIRVLDKITVEKDLIRIYNFIVLLYRKAGL